MKVLFIGDIVGRPGRNAVQALLPELKSELHPDFVIANGENVAAGFGLTYEKYRELMAMGIDALTSGNHIYTKKEFLPYLDDPNVNVIRPANFPENSPGRGELVLEKDGIKLRIINLIGRAFMKIENRPYRPIVEAILSEENIPLTLVDFHAEATSEKAILAYWLDGKISALLGTHTHVPTADSRILPKGTAFQTDVGMTGPLHSSLGAKLENYFKVMDTDEAPEYEVAGGEVVFNATLLELDGETGKALSIQPIQKYYKP